MSSSCSSNQTVCTESTSGLASHGWSPPSTRRAAVPSRAGGVGVVVGPAVADLPGDHELLQPGVRCVEALVEVRECPAVHPLGLVLEQQGEPLAAGRRQTNAVAHLLDQLTGHRRLEHP